MYLEDTGLATKEAVDAAIRYSIGRRLGVTGPLESADPGGLDVYYNIAKYLLLAFDLQYGVCVSSRCGHLRADTYIRATREALCFCFIHPAAPSRLG